jgi:hypothetical protein
MQSHETIYARPVPTSDAIVQTPRVTLRPWRFDEAGRFFDMHRRVEVARWIGAHPMTDRAQATELLSTMQQRRAADPRLARGRWWSARPGSLRARFSSSRCPTAMARWRLGGTCTRTAGDEGSQWRPAGHCSHTASVSASRRSGPSPTLRTPAQHEFARSLGCSCSVLPSAGTTSRR